MHKSAQWKHEREWRIIAPLGDDSAGREWAMPKPSGLYLGHRMATEHRDRITAFGRREGIPMFAMTPSPDGFSLMSERIL